MKKRTTKKDAITVKDLEREIHDLRIGLARQTEMLGSMSQDNRRLANAVAVEERRRHQVQHDLNIAARDLRDERAEHAKTNTTLRELIAKMPASKG